MSAGKDRYGDFEFNYDKIHLRPFSPNGAKKDLYKKNKDDNYDLDWHSDSERKKQEKNLLDVIKTGSLKILYVVASEVDFPDKKISLSAFGWTWQVVIETNALFIFFFRFVLYIMYVLYIFFWPFSRFGNRTVGAFSSTGTFVSTL